MYYPSQYNHQIVLKTGRRRTTRVVNNLLFGAADIVSKPVYQVFAEAEKRGSIPKSRLPAKVWSHFLDKGYFWCDPQAEEIAVRKLAEGEGERDRLAAGLDGGYYGFITSLYCNLACPYCFQRAKADSCGFLTREMVDRGLAVIAECEARATALHDGKETVPKISITGGEPLLRSRANVEVLDYLLEQLAARRWPHSITSNGTELAWFIQEHRLTSNCRNIQVTLDGPPEIHNQRRGFRGGAPSFDQIANGVDAALAAGWNLSLRVNLDMSNVRSLLSLAEYVLARGWTKSPTFFAYTSPVTDHGAIGGYDTPKDEADLLLDLLAVVETNSIVREVFDIRHFRGFNYVEQMLLNKEPRNPSIYRCEAVLGMYIFDPRGDVHVCLEAVGDPSLRVGTYYPQWQLDDEMAARWTRRNVLTMPECNACKIRFLCAGGCTMDGFNHADSARCMPFLRETEIAWQYFARTRPDLFD